MAAADDGTEVIVDDVPGDPLAAIDERAGTAPRTRIHGVTPGKIVLSH